VTRVVDVTMPAVIFGDLLPAAGRVARLPRSPFAEPRTGQIQAGALKVSTHNHALWAADIYCRVPGLLRNGWGLWGWAACGFVRVCFSE